MILYVLDENMELLGTVPLYKTLIWTKRYFDDGFYELYTTTEYFQLLYKGKFLFRNDDERLGLIEDVQYAQDNKGSKTCFAKGYFAERLLSRRVIQRSVSISGTPEMIARKLVDSNVINPTDADRKIPRIALGNVSGIGRSVTMNSTGSRLGEKLYDIESTQGMSHRLRYDYENNVVYFEVWEGKDRRQSQTENSWALFSNQFANIRDIVYERNESDFANFAYVAGEGEGTSRIVVEVDVRETENEERREIYVDARDLQKVYMDENEKEHQYSDEEYTAVLRQRGLEKLEEYGVIEVVNSNVDPLANLEYKVDFDVGDFCTYVNTDCGIELDERITEIQEVYEGSGRTITVTFGNDEATSIKKIIKKEAN